MSSRKFGWVKLWSSDLLAVIAFAGEHAPFLRTKLAARAQLDADFAECSGRQGLGGAIADGVPGAQFIDQLGQTFFGLAAAHTEGLSAREFGVFVGVARRELFAVRGFGCLHDWAQDGPGTALEKDGRDDDPFLMQRAEGFDF